LISKYRKGESNEEQAKERNLSTTDFRQESGNIPKERKGLLLPYQKDKI
jgi:hypothetical protein